MRNEADAVIIGGGNMGVSVLYHLALAGWKNIVLVEKAELTSGATWHAAGLVSRMTPVHALGRCHDYAVELYKSIEKQTGQSAGLHLCGSLRIASSTAHRDWLMHQRDAIIARGQECNWVTPDEIKTLNPLYDLRGITGGIHTPDDGHVDPAGACQAMAKGARLLGAEIIRRNRVMDIRPIKGGDGWEVITEHGTIRCLHVVNAGGYHARRIGAFTGLNLPIVPMQHHYVITGNVPRFDDMDFEIPVTRDDYYTGYFRREQKGALIGLYDTHDAVARWVDGCPWDSENELFDPDYDRITPWLEKCFARMPELRDLGLKRIVNGAITYTPDGAPLVGPAPGLRNYWLCCGATVGIAWAPGLGKYLARWMTEGGTEISMRGFDPRRFDRHFDYATTQARVRETYMTRLAIHFPQDQLTTARMRRLSGAHDRTSTAGAIYEDAGGWERPRLYAPQEWQGREPETWRRSPSTELALAEARAVHESAGLGDFSAFAKFTIMGRDARGFLERICTNTMPQAGGTCLTLLLDETGKIDGEAVVACLDGERFRFITGAASEQRMWDRLCFAKKTGEAVAITNHSDDDGILTIAGTKAREIIAPLTDAAMENDDFPWLRVKEIEIAGVPVIAMRLSFSGVLAWELHAQNKYLGGLWDALMESGRKHKHGIAPFGSLAMGLMRMEKAYRGGHELTNDVGPEAVGQMRFVKTQKPFIGRDALMERMAKRSKTASTIIYMEIEAGDADVHGGEAVFHGGRLVGSITSGGMGPATGKSLAFAFVRGDAAAPGTELTVSLLGEERKARVLGEAVFDPENLQLKK